MSLKVAITGGSGLIGSALSAHLVGRGDTVVHLVRRPPRNSAEITWHPGADPFPLPALDEPDELDAIVHLSGEPLSGSRWTSAKRAEIRRSRIESTRALAKALTQVRRPVRLVSASATGYYGADRGREELIESSPAGTGFLAEVCQAWEGQTAPATSAGHPVAMARTGIVLAPHGGAMKFLKPITKLGIAGPIGSGEQFWPWISLHDEVAALTWLIDHREVTGPVNLAAPVPATQGKIAASIAGVMGRPSVVPTPGLVLKLALGEFADTLLGSQRVLPKVLSDAGFTFAHPTIETAADWLMSSAT